MRVHHRPIGPVAVLAAPPRAPSGPLARALAILPNLQLLPACMAIGRMASQLARSAPSHPCALSRCHSFTSSSGCRRTGVVGHEAPSALLAASRTCPGCAGPAALPTFRYLGCFCTRAQWGFVDYRRRRWLRLPVYNVVKVLSPGSQRLNSSLFMLSIHALYVSR